MCDKKLSSKKKLPSEKRLSSEKKLCCGKSYIVKNLSSEKSYLVSSDKRKKLSSDRGQRS